MSISNYNLSDQMEIIKQHAEAVVKASRNESINESQRLSDEKKAKALAKAKVKYDEIIDATGELSEEMNKVSNWEKESDLNVGRAIRKFKTWKSYLEKCRTCLES